MVYQFLQLREGYRTRNCERHLQACAPSRLDHYTNAMRFKRVREFGKGCLDVVGMLELYRIFYSVPYLSILIVQGYFVYSAEPEEVVLVVA